MLLASFFLGLLDLLLILPKKHGLVTPSMNDAWWLSEQGVMRSHFIVLVNPTTYTDFRALIRDTYPSRL